MPCAHIWTGEEVRQLQRFGDKLKLASSLVGRDDYLATAMLEDALEDLHGLLGVRARNVSKLTGGRP